MYSSVLLPKFFFCMFIPCLMLAQIIETKMMNATKKNTQQKQMKIMKHILCVNYSLDSSSPRAVFVVMMNFKLPD